MVKGVGCSHVSPSVLCGPSKFSFTWYPQPFNLGKTHQQPPWLVVQMIVTSQGLGADSKWPQARATWVLTHSCCLSACWQNFPLLSPEDEGTGFGMDVRLCSPSYPDGQPTTLPPKRMYVILIKEATGNHLVLI